MSSDKVRALKVVLRNDLNENGKCKMAADIKRQLCRYFTKDIFSVCGNVLTDLEEIWYFGIYTKMS